jgi:hypothetical protein
LVHEKPAVTTMSGWGVGVGVGCDAVGVAVGCDPVGVAVGVGGEPVGVGVGDPWRAESGAGPARVSKSKLTATTATSTCFQIVITAFMIHLIFLDQLKKEPLFSRSSSRTPR